MTTHKRIAQKVANIAIAYLAGHEPGFVSAVMVDWRFDGQYIEPKLRMETLLGTWEAWVTDGESIERLRWIEVEVVEV